MKKAELMSTEDYKEFIAQKTKENREVRGYQSSLSKAAGCQPSFFSAAVRGSVHLTPEHAAGLCRFWQFDEDDTNYFLNLVDLARAGSPYLRSVIRRRIELLRKKKYHLGGRLNPQKHPHGENEALYYSSWHYCAIHVITSVPRFRTVKAIQERLGLPAELVQVTLSSLEKMGAVKQKGGHWHAQEKSFHLPRERSAAALHHSHWRHRAMLNAQMKDEEALHYTALHAMSESAFLKVKELLLDLMEESRALVAPSPEEEIFVVTCDLFRA